MNYNSLPVRLRALRQLTVDEARSSTGGEVQMGEVFETDWIRTKHLEREGKAVRIIEVKESGLGPIRDVMIFTPMHRLEAETVLALMNLEWDGALSLVVQRDNCVRVRTLPLPEAGRGENEEEMVKKANHLHQYQRGRELFLQGRYDAMLIIESDVIPPKDALKNLAAMDVDCAYGVYQFRGEGDQINIFEKYPMIPSPLKVGESLNLKPHLLQLAIQERKFPCSGGGFGILLVRRRVIEAIPFRLPEPSWAFCDTPWTEDVVKAGFSQAADMWTICGHKDEDGKVLWPKYASLTPALSRGERGK